MAKHETSFWPSIWSIQHVLPNRYFFSSCIHPIDFLPSTSSWGKQKMYGIGLAYTLSLTTWKIWWTSMHSSMMRTARLLTVSLSIGGGVCPVGVLCPGGGVCVREGCPGRSMCVREGCPGRSMCVQGGVCFWGGVYPSMQWGRHPPTCEHNHRQV